MHPFLLLLLLTLTLLLPPSAAASPPFNPSRFTKSRLSLRHSAASPEEYIEVARPLPFESLTPSCKLNVLSHSFGNTIDLPPTNATYSPPSNCTWSRAAVHFSGASNGSQYDRIAAVWLAGAELLRTSTPEPTPEGVFWNVRKDVTRYSSLLRQSNLTLSVMLENLVNDVYTGVYRVNITFLYYNVSSNGTSNSAVKSPLSLIPRNRKSTTRKLRENRLSSSSLFPLDLNENPADLIIPMSAIGDEGFWFRIQGESDAAYQGIKIPPNAYRAVIEVYVSFHGNDEFWYSNPPDAYIEINDLSTKRGHGAHREVQVKLDDMLVGSIVPFPVIFTGGINPLFWEPVVSIGAFDLPTYEFELTPFLGLLLDGNVHYVGLGVDDAISFWLVDANLHLWLDDKVEKVQAGLIKHENPESSVEREYEFQQLDGDFEVEGSTEVEYSGWVNCSAGNFTTSVSHKLKFENTVKFGNNGTEKTVEQEVKLKNKVRMVSGSGSSVANLSFERKFPLKMTTTTLPGSAKGTSLMTTKLENSMEEKQQDGEYESELKTTQQSEGWMFVVDHDVLSGAATTSQSYEVRDSFGCYSRRISVDAGSIKNDIENLSCSSATFS